MNRVSKIFVATLVAVLAIVVPAQASATSLADSADCFAPVPVQPTTWSGIKAMYSSPATAAAWNTRLRTKSAPAFSVTIVASSDEHVDLVPEDSILNAIRQLITTRMIAMMRALNPRYWLMMGDMTEKGSQEEFDILATLVEFLRSIIRANPGNHEGFNPEGLAAYRLFVLGTPYGSTYGDAYRFDDPEIGMRFIAGSASYVEAGNEGYLAWLEEQLRSAPEGYFVSYQQHHPPFSQAKRGGFQAKALDRLVPLLNRYRVDLVLCGHSHAFEAYQTGMPADVNECPPLFIVTGGGGMEISPKGPGDVQFMDTQVYEERHHFIKMEVTQTSLHLQAITVESPTGPGGQILFERTLTRRGCLDRSQL